MTWFSELSKAPAFALLHRADRAGVVEILTGDLVTRDRLADLTKLADSTKLAGGHESKGDGAELLALVPYRQLNERSYACVDDAAPLRALVVRARWEVSLAEVRRVLPRRSVPLRGTHFDLDDARYAELVRRVIGEEIGHGAGSNFVMRRTYLGDIGPVDAATALGMFGGLLRAERGAYWTFVVHTAEVTLVGATPERHATLRRGVVEMTPISGTYRYPPGGPTVEGLLEFLADPKEADELSMVVDEELKMLGRLCPSGGRVSGPWLREMAHLAHTEYAVSGRTEANPTEVLAATMFAPTVVGSPLRSAAEVVTRYEARGRGYYGGVLARFGREDGERTLDSAICLRSAHITADGRLTLDVGASIVRGSNPEAEAAETAAKAAGLLAAITGTDQSSGQQALTSRRPQRLARDARVRDALAARARGLAPFWRGAAPSRMDEVLAGAQVLPGTRVLIVDAEDEFTAMLAVQIRALGARVRVRSHRELSGLANLGDVGELADLVVVGPGPGDPRNREDPRIDALHRITGHLLAARVPTLSVCLGHQVLAAALGLALRRKAVPTQGTRRQIDFAGQRREVGFYSTFSAYSGVDTVSCPITGEPVTIHRDHHTGEVFGLAKPGLRSVQFHIESVLTMEGPDLLAQLLRPLARTGARV